MWKKKGVKKGKSVKSRIKRVGLSPFEENRLRCRLRWSACGEPWVDAQLKTVIDRLPDETFIVCRYFDAHVFPPGGNQTTMRWCRRCGRYTPAHCVHLIEHRRKRSGPVISATLQCDDCRIARDDEVHRELYAALPHLRPGGSLSFVRMGDLLARRQRAT